MKKKSLLVFDIDGTLTNSIKAHQKAFTEALYDLGVKTIDTNFKEYKHYTDSYIAKVIYEKDTNQEFSDIKIKEFENYLTKRITRSKINEILGAKKLIEYLETQSEFAVCYATGSLLKPAIFKLDSIGIKYSKKQLVASNNIHEREDIVLKAIENALEFYAVNTFNRIIAVGDGLWDLKTAHNLDLEFIGIGSSNKKNLVANGMKKYFENLTNFKIEEHPNLISIL